jgi:four helix bundle protein
MHSSDVPSSRPQASSVEPLAHERLDAYRVALDFLALAHGLALRLPRAKGQLGDQLGRAAEGIVLRIAEGAGAEWRSADQQRYFRSARGSALECSAVLDICRIHRVGSAAELAAGRALLLRLCQMLSRLSRQAR